jgi:hypothetical protein
MVNNTNGVALCYPFRRAPEIDIGVGVGIGVERRGNKKTIPIPTATPKMLRLYSQRSSAAGNNSLPPSRIFNLESPRNANVIEPCIGAERFIF